LYIYPLFWLFSPRRFYQQERTDFMNESIVIERAGALTPLGDLDGTARALLRGERALRSGPCCGVPAAFAPFPDTRCRDIRRAASLLAAVLRTADRADPCSVFINCSAKGDIRSLEDVVRGAADRCGGPAVPPLVDCQAVEACCALGLSPSRTISVSAACASGAIAVETAKELLEDRRHPRAVLFGIESMCEFVATGFHALSALSPSGARPFDAKRDGLSLGEAAVVAVLSFRLPLPGDIVVAGAGSSNDANHRTGPSRTGDGLYQAAAAALHDAGMDPGDIGAIKCHGTATLYNDAMEAKAVDRLFGGACPPCVSFKGAIGHTSGAGSLLDMLLAAQCLKTRTLPPTAGFETMGVDEKIRISGSACPFDKPSVLCLSAGFGGINAAVIISEVRA
jgi:3-oxoacyl-[acyl-carrier-protein] synthase-1